MVRLIVWISLLLYVVSCSSSNSVSSPSSRSSLDSIRSLTLSGVDENRITIDWDLLRTEEGAIHPTIVYTVYAETPAEEGVFTNVPDTETVYTLLSSVDLGGGRRSTVLPIDSTWNRTDGIEVSGLANDTPYRIVVEARDASGNFSQARLLAYTSSALVEVDIAGLEAIGIFDSDRVTVTWDIKEGAQSYAIQALYDENQFGGGLPTDNVIIVCPPHSLLCESPEQFAQVDQVEEGKLKYTFRVNHRGSRYKIAVIPFNFQDLTGLQAVDEAGVEKTFIEEVRTQIEEEGSTVGGRLKSAMGDPDKFRKVQLQVSVAGAATDLVLDSTGNTLSASWGHGAGAEYYYAILTNDEVVITNIIDRYDVSGRFTGGGYVGFGGLTPNTAYTVTVQSLMLSNSITNLGGEVSATLSTKDATNTLDAPEKIAGENLILSSEAGRLGIAWNTPESNSVIGYNVFYWIGEVAPTKPQYVARKGETDLTFTVLPDSYHVRIDVLSTYPGQEVVTGGSDSIAIYGKPLAPQDLGITFNRGSFTKIDNKLYAIGYPLTYTEAETPAEAGGPVGDVAYHYRYRVGEGEWVGYSEVMDEAMISLQVDDLSDAAVIKNVYGEKYQVEVVASNAGGFVSDARTLEFTYQSFPEPFKQSNHLVVETGDRSLTVTWPAVSEVNGSIVANYTVVLSENPYAVPVQSITTVERRVVFEELVNNQPYLITVIPNGVVTGNIFTALTMVTGHTIGSALEQGSEEERILAAYTGVPEPHVPQGRPGMVVGLEVAAGDDLATVTWGEPARGSPATRYVLEYLSNVTAPITHIYISGDAADAELSGLSWEGVVSVEVTNDTGSYSHEVAGLNVLSATNVFRVKAVRIDDSGKEWVGGYRYYALGTDLSRAPSSVGELTFSGHDLSGFFTVSWSKPDEPGQDKDGSPARLVGYKVSWGTTTEVEGGSTEITYPATLSYTITNLTPGTQYYVLVQAKNDNAEGNIYHAGSRKNTYTVKPPGEVVDSTIVYSEHTIDGFKVSWDAVTDAGYGPEGKSTSAGYLLQRSSDQGTNWQPIARSDASATEEFVTDLFPGTEYKVRVQAFNSFFDSPGSTTTLKGSPAEGGETWTLSLPGPVGGLLVSEPDYDGTNHRGGFKVGWTAPSNTGISFDGSAASPIGYEVAYTEVVDGIPGEYTSVTLGVTTEYVFTGLKANAEYDLRIRARTAAGVGVGKHVSAWVPSPPGAVDPDSILFSHPTAGTIRVEWPPPPPGRAGGSSSNYINTLYRVEIGQEGSDYVTIQESYSSNAITATGLSRSTTYHARITAKNPWGEARAFVSTSTETTAETDATPPSAVGDLKVVSLTDNEVVLSWREPTNRGTTDGTTAATLTGYIVKYTETAKSNFIEIDEKSEEVRLDKALTGSSTNATVTGLDGNTAYTFLVVAVHSGNAVGLDTEAPRVEQTTAPAPPGGLENTLPCAKTTSVELAWDTSSGATSYQLYRDDAPIGSTTTTSYTDTGLTPGMPYTYTVRACKDTACSSDSTSVTIDTLSDKSFKSIIDSKSIPVNLTGYDPMSREIFSLYNSGASIVAKYIQTNGSGNGDSFTNAAKKLKTILDGISDAGVNNIYVVLLSGGTYKPEGEMSMKNHVAIVGGVDECLNPSDTVTALDGEGTRRVFYHYNNSLDHTALLYGVTVTNGEDSRHGGGMYNYNSSPSLIRVTFSGNTAGEYGGGMYNENSSPSLTQVTFSSNTADVYGGGMKNYNSSPSLIRVTFSGNTAYGGGGMMNGLSSSSLTEVTFSSNTADDDGGGMANWYSSPTLNRVTFSGNTADDDGGGMHNNNSSSSLTQVTFSGNTADDGGGMYNRYSSPSLIGVTFSGNTAGNRGGGMANWQYSSPSLIGVTFSGNTASWGGGMYNSRSSSPTLNRVTFSGNTAGNYGGGMFNGDDSSSPTLNRVTFSENTASNGGGGMANWQYSSPSLIGVTFSENTAGEYGGGMFNGGGSPTLIGVTFSGNTAGDDGGGMANYGSSLRLVGVTFFKNTAGEYGGGMYNDNDSGDGLTIINGIFWGNTISSHTGSGPQFYLYNDSFYQETLRIYNSIVEGGTGTLASGRSYTRNIDEGGFVSGGGTAEVRIFFANITNADPELGALANNGGSVWTHAIPSDSPAVDQGLYVMRKGSTNYYSRNNTQWYTEPDLSGTPENRPTDAEDLTATDARGYNRKDEPDLGAYEYR